jgi:hypothetical protein
MKPSNLWGAVSACVITASSLVAHAAPISGQGTWESTLQGRDLDGNLSTFEAYYDTVLDITWLANANAGGGSYYDGVDGTLDGALTWANANAWAASLDLDGVAGADGWRLPTVTDTGAPGCDYSDTGGTDCGFNMNTASGEMVSMFYDTLGNLAYYDTGGNAGQSGWGLTNTGPFSNLIEYYYWSATEYAPDPQLAWFFHFTSGSQNYDLKTYSILAWAVHPGDFGVSAVPVPAALWLFGSGLLGLLGVARQRRP